ncbi:MAPEG family protein [Fluoribacter dumoffii]|uniref:Inner membrane protein yecN n=1 Tax=Fluoribacter dumoffii TaxID=463 RepID=A0A377GD91_9GAMM|nr:MAPEG family protein [Fluoribacter dumoffii]KTC91110.1 glutathione S-transferase [Fluoribacter dumoffii NY 23]MCW8387722.1 MAPEG family protein [Fluoribacter dumoffii]MCW8416719.1 MAPEG family protein [Fluoribacter dumoffii]MCW8455441.1 MAPEG family protein [Fluoribacter dumoffii]MCW8460481.1 MAPEG family protein [Fluoribacter dumoffii]
MYPLTTLTASLFALAYIFLSIYVVSLRRKHKVIIGSKEFIDLEMAIRAHGNFAEYVPFTLILLFCAEANNANWILLLALILFFVIGRIFHAYAFLAEKHHLKFRVRGMILTFTVIACLSLLNLILLVST